MAAPTYGSSTADGGVGPQPLNGIVVSGCPKVQYLNIETVANMYPGRLVIKGTTDHDIAVCAAGGKAIGVLGYEHAPKKFRPTTRDTIYTVLDEAPVISGPGTVVLLMVAISQTIVKGDKLVAVAAGEVGLASAAAPPSGTVAVVSTSAQPTMAGPMATAGIVVAEAEESITTDGATHGFVMARLLF
jgi:hypothetical protein